MTEEIIKNTKQRTIAQYRNEILFNELKGFEKDDTITIDEAIQFKFNQVSEFVSLSFPISNIQDAINQVDQFNSIELPKKRRLLNQKVAQHVKTVLEVLDVTWSIMEQFKYKNEKAKNIMFDNHYTSLVDTLLLKVKILHLTVLLATYGDEEFIQAIESLKGLLEKRCINAETHLKYSIKQIEEYIDIGPEFKTLSKAYETLLYKIQATKDDINRIKS